MVFHRHRGLDCSEGALTLGLHRQVLSECKERAAGVLAYNDLVQIWPGIIRIADEAGDAEKRSLISTNKE